MPRGSATRRQLAGSDTFTKKEWDGFQLFMDEDNGSGRWRSHVRCLPRGRLDRPRRLRGLDVIVPDWSPDGTVPPVFTDFTYDNLGVPKSTHKLLRDFQWI